MGIRLAVAVLLTSVTALALCGQAEASFPGANGKIVFTTARTGHYDLYTMNPDGTAQTPITNDLTYDFNPAWSADGAKIVWDKTYDIYTMNADGTGATNLTNTGSATEDVHPAWSPDGTQIVFVSNRDGVLSLYKMNGDGTGVARLTNQPSEYSEDPDWSPDGTKIAFWRIVSGVAQILTINADGTGETQLTSQGGLFPSWSPDGSKLAYTAGQDIWVMNADGTGKVDLTNSPGFPDDTNAAWSPDGTKIAYSAIYADGCSRDIHVMNADGTGDMNATNSPCNDADPSWQPLPRASYEHPQSAASLTSSLTPLFKQCGAGISPNSSHAPPLATGSCSPPVPSSPVAIVGPQMQGSAQLTVIPGDLDPTNGDQADVGIATTMNDIRATGGGDYDPNPSGSDLTEVTRLRMTDQANGYGGVSATTTDVDFSVPVDCTATADPSVGSTCQVNTTADTVMPGFAREQRQTIAQMFRIRIYDSGLNGTRENGLGDDKIFLHQGVFIP